MAREEGPGWTQFKEQTVTGAWHGVELVRFDADGQRCTTSPPFPATEARAVTDTVLAGIREGQGTIDPRGVLECAVLLDHGRWFALPAADRARFGVDLLKQFMGTHHAELAAAHVNAARALEIWRVGILQGACRADLRQDPHVPDVGGLDAGAGACPMGECLACFGIAAHILPC